MLMAAAIVLEGITDVNEPIKRQIIRGQSLKQLSMVF